MRIFTNLAEWITYRDNVDPSLSIGFVPTMGNLHAGHLSLIQRSQSENHRTVVSIFINPTQFNEPADFNRYPRTIEKDLLLLKESAVDYVLLPSTEAIYPYPQAFTLQEHPLSQILEGEKRPGHFNGVLGVVMVLLNLVKPLRAYFGEKDYQQYLLIKKMVDAFFMGIFIIPCPTVREKSGLAYSSRNTLLTAEQRQWADQFAQIFHQPTSAENIEKALIAMENISIDYLTTYEGRLYVAIKIGDIRLIDNKKLNDTCSQGM